MDKTICSDPLTVPSDDDVPFADERHRYLRYCEESGATTRYRKGPPIYVAERAKGNDTILGSLRRRQHNFGRNISDHMFTTTYRLKVGATSPSCIEYWANKSGCLSKVVHVLQR
jgi:hypothetical protein